MRFLEWSTALVTAALTTVLVFEVACTPAQRAAAKTAFDVASEACRFAYGEHPSELPQGWTADRFCAQALNVQPFVDHILSAQHAQALELGTARSTTDGGS